MGFITVLGKLLIVASIAFQAYLFFADKQTISAFDRQLAQALSACDCLTPEIQALVKQHLRLVIVGLLGSSVLFLLCRCWSFKLPTLLGLGLLLWVEHHEVFRKIPTWGIVENTGLWHSLGLLGVVIYLIGAECTACNKEKCAKEGSKDAKGGKEETKEKVEQQKKKKQ